MKLIVGLGNPGVTYARTRHNAGFITVDRLAEIIGASKEKKQGQALVRTAGTGADRLMLVKPQSYMNLSGNPLWELIHFYKDRVEGFIVVHDDLDLPLGKIRFKSGGGSGGHRGLNSITSRLGSDEYDRLKIGIGRPPAPVTAEAWVLQAFSAEETGLLDKVVERAIEGLRCWLDQGCIEAMNRYNAMDLKPPQKEDDAKSENDK